MSKDIRPEPAPYNNPIYDRKAELVFIFLLLAFLVIAFVVYGMVLYG